MNRLLTNIISILIFGIITFHFASCVSHSGTNGDAFESLQQDKMMTGDSATVSQKEEEIKIVKPIETQRKEKKEVLNDWAQFNVDMEKRIDANENKILEIKAIPLLSVDAFNKVTALEKENHGLRLELYDYVEIDIEKHKKFKEKFAEQLMAIKISLEEISLKATVDALMLL